jgi:hypothetical protein
MEVNTNNRLSLLRLILERFWVDRVPYVGRELDADKVMMSGDELNAEYLIWKGIFMA